MVITICTHCEEKCSEGNKFCVNCNSVEKRKEMCEANNKIRNDNGLPSYICRLDCLGIQKEMVLRKNEVKAQETPKTPLT